MHANTPEFIDEQCQRLRQLERVSTMIGSKPLLGLPPRQRMVALGIAVAAVVALYATESRGVPTADGMLVAIAASLITGYALWYLLTSPTTHKHTVFCAIIKYKPVLEIEYVSLMQQPRDDETQWFKCVGEWLQHERAALYESLSPR